MGGSSDSTHPPPLSALAICVTGAVLRVTCSETRALPSHRLERPIEQFLIRPDLLIVVDLLLRLFRFRKRIGGSLIVDHNNRGRPGPVVVLDRMIG